MTGYTLFGIVPTTVVGCCSKTVCTNLFIWCISVDVLVHCEYSRCLVIRDNWIKSFYWLEMSDKIQY